MSNSVTAQAGLRQAMNYLIDYKRNLRKNFIGNVYKTISIYNILFLNENLKNLYSSSRCYST
jgi:hypothetical protein